MNVLSCVSWFLDDDMRCGWDDVILILELTLCRIMRFTFISIFSELFARIQDVGMSSYPYWTISVMSIWMVNLWFYNLLWCRDWWMNLWWHKILIWMIITCMHWWMTLHVSRHISWGCLVGPQPSAKGYRWWLTGMDRWRWVNCAMLRDVFGLIVIDRHVHW